MIDGEELLLGGDIVLFIGDLQVNSDPEQLQRIDDALGRMERGQTVSVRVLREGQVIDLSLTLP